MLVIKEMLFDNFLLERLNTWELRILQGKVLKTLKYRQYLTTCSNVTPL